MAAVVAILVAAVASAATHFITKGSAPVAGWLLAGALSWMSMIDADRLILPDLLTLGILTAGLAWRAMAGPDYLIPGLIGAVVGYLALAAVAAGYRAWRGKDGLGGGDAKLLAAGGAWLGWMSLPSVLLIASVTGLLVAIVARVLRQKHPPNEMIPFGPFLAIGIWSTWTATFLIGA